LYFAIIGECADAAAIELFYHDWRRIPQQRQHSKLICDGRGVKILVIKFKF
jgi:hypothetical protein